MGGKGADQPKFETDGVRFTGQTQKSGIFLTVEIRCPIYRLPRYM